MKLYNIILSGLLLSSMASCDGNDILPEIPETPEQPTDSVATEGYQFIFGGSTDTEEEDTRASWTDEITGNDGKRHLVFGWDYTDKSNPTYEMKMYASHEHKSKELHRRYHPEAFDQDRRPSLGRVSDRRAL